MSDYSPRSSGLGCLRRRWGEERSRRRRLGPDLLGYGGSGTREPRAPSAGLGWDASPTSLRDTLPLRRRLIASPADINAIVRARARAPERLASPARLFTLYATTFKVIVLSVCECVCVRGGGDRFSETDWELIGVEACDTDSLGEHM